MLVARFIFVGAHDTNEICARQAKSTVIIALLIWNCMLFIFYGVVFGLTDVRVTCVCSRTVIMVLSEVCIVKKRGSKAREFVLPLFLRQGVHHSMREIDVTS